MKRALLVGAALGLCACQQFDLNLDWDPSPRMFETSSFRVSTVRFRPAAPGTAVVVIAENAGFDVSLVEQPEQLRSFRADLKKGVMRELGSPLPTVTSDFKLGWVLGAPASLQVVYSETELAVLDGDVWTPRPFPPATLVDVLALYVLTADVLVVVTPQGLFSLSGSTWKPIVPELGASAHVVAYEPGRLRVVGQDANGKTTLTLLDPATGVHLVPDVVLGRPYGELTAAGFNGTVNDFVFIVSETVSNVTASRPVHFVDGVLRRLPQAQGVVAEGASLRVPGAFRPVLVGLVPLEPAVTIEAERQMVLGRPGFTLVERPVLDVVVEPQPAPLLECTELSPVCPEFSTCLPNANDNGKACYREPPTATLTWHLVLPPGLGTDDVFVRIVSATNPTAGPAPVDFVQIGVDWEVRLQPSREVLVDFVLFGATNQSRRVTMGAKGSVTELGTITLERRIEGSVELDRDVSAPPSLMHPSGAVLFVSTGQWKAIVPGPTTPMLLPIGDSADQPGAPLIFPAGLGLLLSFADGSIHYERNGYPPLVVDVASNSPRLGELVMAREAVAFVLPIGQGVGGQYGARFNTSSALGGDVIQAFNLAGDSNAISANGLWFARREGTTLAVRAADGSRTNLLTNLMQPLKLIVTNDGNEVAVLDGACVASPGAACTVQLVRRSQPTTPVAISSGATRVVLNEAGTVFLLDEGAGLVRLDVASMVRTPVTLPQGFVIGRAVQWADRLLLVGLDRTVLVLDVSTGVVQRTIPPRARLQVSASGRVVAADACSGADPCAVSVYTPWDDVLTNGAASTASGPFIGAPPDRYVTISSGRVLVTTPGAATPVRVVDEVTGAMPTFDPLFEDVVNTAGAPCAIYRREGIRFCAY